MSTSAPKTRVAWGYMAKLESTYQTDPVLANATDGLLLCELPTFDHGKYLYDGKRGTTPAGVPNIRAARNGLEGTHKVCVEAMGANVAYSSSIFPGGQAAFHAILRACGLQAVGSFGAGSENWIYSPMVGPTNLDSLTVQGYVEGQLYKMYGCYGDFSITAKGPEIPKWEFDLIGTADESTDASIPAITYPTLTQIPPVATNITATIGAFSAGIVKEFIFKMNRKHDTKRVNISGSGSHYGFAPLPPNPTLELVVEKLALKTATPWSDGTTLNPYQLRNTGTLINLSIQVGSTQYNRWKLWAGNPTSAAQAQLVEVAEEKEGPTGQWKLVFEFKPSTYGATDMVSIKFD